MDIYFFKNTLYNEYRKRVIAQNARIPHRARAPRRAHSRKTQRIFCKTKDRLKSRTEDTRSLPAPLYEAVAGR